MKKIFTYTMMALTALVMFTSCEDDDGYIATTLRNRDWQGYIGAYYQNRWRLTGDEYATVMRFESKDEFYTSGRGYEVDYDTRSPYQDYAYCTFKWFIVDGEITLIYDDSKWNPIYIERNYYLTSSHFAGFINDGSGRTIRFDLENAEFDGWDNYGRYGTGGYGGFSNQQYYHAPKAKPGEALTEAKAPLVLDRTEQVRRESGVADAVSIASGKFAEAMNNM